MFVWRLRLGVRRSSVCSSKVVLEEGVSISAGELCVFKNFPKPLEDNDNRCIRTNEIW